jgi:hypothetical protein
MKHGRTLALALGCLIAGLAGGAFVGSQLGSRPAEAAPSGPTAAQEPPLSGATSNLLEHLEVPLDLRFYTCLGPAAMAAYTPAYVERVERLLAQFERVSGGKVRLVRRDFPPNSAVAKAAQADGITPFKLRTSQECYLGIAVAGKGHKESLGQLEAQWEPALEFDLARAIARAAQAEPQPLPAAVAPRGGPQPLDEIKRLIPNLGAVSVEEGVSRLRGAAVAELARATQESQARIQEVEQELIRAQTNGSDAEQQAALGRLRQLQAEQTGKLREIAARSQAEVQTFKRLKGAVR